jgi:N4-(beta-N-acetylglucosaminyl)-L-asparaginase
MDPRMNRTPSRRELVTAAAAAGAFAAAAAAPAVTTPAFAQAPSASSGQAPQAAPQVLTKGARPVVVASANGNQWKDVEGLTCVAKAFRMIAAGADVLDAVVAGVNIVELDPEETGVGYGGLPNADGVVQLDASVMHGPKKRAGAVACLEGVRTPSLVAKAVMEQTDHVLLVGRDAQRFARNLGFKIEDDLNTEKSRKLWLEWKRRTDGEHYPNPKTRAEAWDRERLRMIDEGLIRADHAFGTINCNGLSAKGELAGVTTTSGLSWKIPGRVGDSPIIGAGLYVDNEVGAAGSTGRGEANLFALGSFVVVEQMRGGASPKDAGMAALKRLVANVVEKRLLNNRGKPNFNVSYYVINARGDHAGVSLYGTNGNGPVKYAVCTEDGPKTVEMEGLLPGTPTD